MIARGLLAIVFALVAAFAPREQLGSATQLAIRVDFADYLLMAYIGLNAVLLAGQGIKSRHLRMLLWGQAVIALPAELFLFLADTPGQLRASVCAWALLHGALELWMFKDLRGTTGSTDHLYAGLAHLLLAVILAFGDFGALTILGFTSAAMLISGVLYLLGGLGRRKYARANQPG